MKALGIRTAFIVSSLASVIGFLVTIFNAFSGIENFHGTWVDFLVYLGEGLLDGVISFGIVFVMVGTFAFLICSYLDERNMRSHTVKKEKVLKEQLKEKGKE